VLTIKSSKSHIREAVMNDEHQQHHMKSLCQLKWQRLSVSWA